MLSDIHCSSRGKNISSALREKFNLSNVAVQWILHSKSVPLVHCTLVLNFHASFCLHPLRLPSYTDPGCGPTLANVIAADLTRQLPISACFLGTLISKNTNPGGLLENENCLSWGLLTYQPSAHPLSQTQQLLPSAFHVGNRNHSRYQKQRRFSYKESDASEVHHGRMQQ